MARGYRAGSAVSRRAVFGVPALAEAVGATFAHGATELVENRPSKRRLSGADAITSLTSVDPGAPLTLTAACTLEDNDDSSGTSLVGSVTDAGGAVVVTIGDFRLAVGHRSDRFGPTGRHHHRCTNRTGRLHVRGHLYHRRG